ncbi:MAG: Asp23/Gls24 family envelope stress response protein [Lachnospiraceae bacterium]|nr:Asp23/Gls24 family envelope stress response protein [Lachnospiraceae bacterium]
MENSAHTIAGGAGLGSVQVADDVVAIIAGIAAVEVDGVSAMSGNFSNELMGKMGYKSLTRGVKVEILNQKVKIELALTMDYGYNIPATSSLVQNKVKNAVENMTGLEVVDVDIRIAAIDMKKGK